MNRKVLVVTGVVILSLVSCCGVCMIAGLLDGGAGALNGRYECQTPGSVLMNGVLMTQYQPTGMWFVIDGDGYSTNGPGGSVRFDAEVVTFTGGGYDGWRGARADDAIVFRKDHADPRPGESPRFGDLRCGRVP